MERTLKEHQCATCGKPFRTLLGRNKYCSLLCQGLRIVNEGYLLPGYPTYVPSFAPVYAVDDAPLLARRKAYRERQRAWDQKRTKERRLRRRAGGVP